jgi:endonuclease YncB( thermonuclease family)
MMRHALLCLLLLAPLPAAAESITGIPRIVDGDSLVVNGIMIRAEGYDAPEWDQVCHRGDPPRGYRCGLAATDALRSLIAGRAVDCEPVPQENGSPLDRYGRTLARCSVGGQDIGAWMVEHGHARAFVRYSDRYVPEERRAQEARVGMWAGPHMAPWEWRQAKRARY